MLHISVHLYCEVPPNQVGRNNSALYTSAFLLLPFSAVTSSINTSEAAIHICSSFPSPNLICAHIRAVIPIMYTLKNIFNSYQKGRHLKFIFIFIKLIRNTESQNNNNFANVQIFMDPIALAKSN